MLKQFGEINLLCVTITYRTDGLMKNKPVFHLNNESYTYYFVKGILHLIILNTTSLITVMLCF